jgi:riboflavin kinase/FMN adenylyltransferase
MKIYNNVSELKNFNNLCATIGTFDGVHCGHKKIIQKLVDKAKEIKGESMIITFEPHPRIVLGKSPEQLRFINTADEKLNQFEKLNVDYVLVINFTREFSQYSTEEFAKIYLKDKLHIKHLIVGHDHMFGNRSKSDGKDLKDILKKYNISCEIVDAQLANANVISSTKIRNALLEGDIQKANKYLGYQYSFLAKVVSGRKIGRTIGFPTANLSVIGERKVIPKDGVYHVEIEHQNHIYNGVMNIGLNPTVDNKFRTIEVHILNFDKDIYNSLLEVRFYKRIRGEMKFDSVEELRKQIQLDVDFIG